MATIDFQHLSVLITLFAAALTLSVNAGPDGAASVPPIPTSDPSPKSLSPIVEHSSDVIDDKKVSKVNVYSSLAYVRIVPILFYCFFFILLVLLFHYLALFYDAFIYLYIFYDFLHVFLVFSCIAVFYIFCVLQFFIFFLLRDSDLFRL